MKKIITIISQPVLLSLAVSQAHAAATFKIPNPVNVPADISLGDVISAVVGILLLFGFLF